MGSGVGSSKDLRNRLNQMFPPWERPKKCKGLEKTILADQSGTALVCHLADVFEPNEIGMILSDFLNRSKRVTGYVPAGLAQANFLLKNGVPEEWQQHILVFPGMVTTPVRNFYQCFCVPFMAFIGDYVRLGNICSYDLVSPDYRPVLLRNRAVFH